MERIKNALLEKKSNLERMETKIKKKLLKAPEGTLILSKSNGKTQYYHKTNDTGRRGRYIPEKQMELAKALAQKDYDTKMLAAIVQDKKMIEEAYKKISDLKCINTYHNLSDERRRLVDAHILTDEEYIEEWLNEKYEGKSFGLDTPMHITEKGERVRSKTEKMIADKLYTMNIPYRYECPLLLKGYGKVYPDFTLLRMYDRREVYYEHFGMMDNPQYVQNMISKINEYTNNGIYLGKNLFVTFETMQQPLNLKNVEKMLKELLY